MTKVRAHKPRATVLTGWRFWVVTLVLAAFSLQSYVVQTHIHFDHESAGLLAGDDGSNGKLSAKTSDRHDNFPDNDDPAKCPICQQIIHSGQFVTPSQQALLLPTLAISTVQLVDRALPRVLVLSHSWLGRAPPRF